MPPHIDELRRLFDGGKGSLYHRIGRSYKGDHGAVGGPPRIHIQEPDSFHRLNPVGDSADHLRVVALAEVGDAFQ